MRYASLSSILRMWNVLSLVAHKSIPKCRMRLCKVMHHWRRTSSGKLNSITCREAISKNKLLQRNFAILYNSQKTTINSLRFVIFSTLSPYLTKEIGLCLQKAHCNYINLFYCKIYRHPKTCFPIGFIMPDFIME